MWSVSGRFVARLFPWVAGYYVGTTAIGFWVDRKQAQFEETLDDQLKELKQVPDRAQQIRAAKRASNRDRAFDMLVIGGGCAGAGIALDAVTRGLNTLLVEKDDFSSGTSSRYETDDLTSL